MAGTQVLPTPPAGGGGGGGAPTNAQYVTLATDATLTNERVLTAGANITLTDNGAGNSLVIAAAGGAGTPATTVVSEQSYGQSPVVGTSTNYAREDHSHGTPASAVSSSFFNALFGDAGDGDVTITGFTQLSREMHYNNLTVTATGRLKPVGNRIFVAGTLTIASGGSIDDDGGSATGFTGATGFVARNYLGGSGTNAGSGWTAASVTAANGNPAVANTNSSPNALNVQPAGGNGGNSSTRTGGLGGAAPANATTPQRWSGRILDGRATFGAFNGGAGGGGGALTITTYTLGAFNSGGGGAGAGIVWLAAKTISNSGNISAKGGNGANASVPGAGVGEVGGGGGGGGGLVAIITKSTSVGGTVSVAGGTGGTGAAVGGGTGGNGTAGADGAYVLMVVS